MCSKILSILSSKICSIKKLYAVFLFSLNKFNTKSIARFGSSASLIVVKISGEANSKKSLKSAIFSLKNLRLISACSGSLYSKFIGATLARSGFLPS